MKTRIGRTGRFGLALATSILGAPMGGATPYEIVDVGSCKSYSLGDLNDAETACIAAGSSLSAARWTRSGGLVDLGAGNYSYAMGINAQSVVVGQATGRAVLWSPDGGMTQLGALPAGGVLGMAMAINDAGVVVGTSGSALYNTHEPFVWTAAGGIAAVPTLGGTRGMALGINASGHIVGASKTATSTYEHAFWWSGNAGDPPVDLAPSKDYGMAYAVNDLDHVAGVWGAMVKHSFLWSAAGGLQELTSTGDQCWARDLNDSDLVVGYYQVHGTADYRACMWQGAGAAIDLNTLVDPGSGWVLTHAFAVNAAGSILGTGTLHGEERAFLLSVPGNEPAPPPPAIRCAEDGRVVIAWPSGSSMQLLESHDLQTWTPCAVPPVERDGLLEVTVDPGTQGAPCYFRLADGPVSP